MTTLHDPPRADPPAAAPRPWTYDEAFKRNLGLISDQQQRRLRSSRIAIAGMGGVGGVHLETLARQGVGAFTIADYDRFECANLNRQHGATLSTLGRSKVEVMAELARDINPELNLRVLNEAITHSNVDNFLDGADLVVDGLDFFAPQARRLVFNAAARRGLWVITAGPIGDSVAWLVFDPNGVSFDDYFNVNDNTDPRRLLACFAVGLFPRATQRRYMDLSRANLEEKCGPSVAAACRGAAHVVGVEARKILLNHGRVRPAPAFHQFDPHTYQLASGRLTFGNRGPIQRLKIALVTRRFANQAAPPEPPPGPTDLLLRAFRLAPSGDNTQPWRCRVIGREFSIEVDPTRDQSPMNAGQRMSRIACGAGLENLVQTAIYNDWTPEVTLCDDPERVATVRFAEWPTTPVVGAPTAIGDRHTNRLAYDAAPIDSGLLTRLRSSVTAEEGLRLGWFVDRREIEEIAEHVARTDSAMFSQAEFFRAFLQNVNFGRDQPDGLPVKTLGVSQADRWLLPWLKRAPLGVLRMGPVRAAIRHKSRIAARGLIRSSSGVVVVYTAEQSPKADVRVGRLLQRVWLALTELDFDAQPMMSDPVLRNAAPELLPSRPTILAEGGTPAAVLRFGRGPSVGARAKRIQAC